MEELILSTLPKTWLFDLDGTIVKHNGHLHGDDILLDGVQEFFDTISEQDKVILLTSRPEIYRENTLRFLVANQIRFDAILFGLPMGERVLVNDRKNSGLTTAYAVNLPRDSGFCLQVMLDENL